MYGNEEGQGGVLLTTASLQTHISITPTAIVVEKHAEGKMQLQRVSRLSVHIGS